MTGKLPHRDVGPIVQMFRALVRGRKFIPHLRFADDIVARSQPPPNIPGGPYHRTSKIYYHTHDARRLVEQPVVLAVNKQIGPGTAMMKPQPRPPNETYNAKLIDPPKSNLPEEVGQTGIV